MMDRGNQLNIPLTSDEEKVLAAAYGHFKETGTWIGWRTLQMKFGKKGVEQLEQRQNPRLIFKFTEAGKEVYKWTLAAFLLSENAKDDVVLLCRYLEFMKQLLNDNPEIEMLTSSQVENELKIDKRTSARLIRIIAETSCWGGGRYGVGGDSWKARPPNDVMDLVDVEALDFLEGRVKNEMRSEARRVEAQDTAANVLSPPKAVEEAIVALSNASPMDSFLPLELFRGTRKYVRAVAEQCCGSYDKGYYDATSVLSRRLLETLIIEAFEAHRIDDRIKNPDGSFFYLSALITAMLNERDWNLSRSVKKALPLLKDLGDQSAHNRRYLAKKADLDDIKRDFRLTIEELLHLSKLTK